MIQTGFINNAHGDLLTCAAYDYYGSTLATSGMDQRVCVWEVDLGGEGGEWKVKEEWKAHNAPVANVAWAHPEFGQVLASASFDRSVKIWEREGRGKWVEKAVLLDMRGTVVQVEFAPNVFGLKVAVVATDGYVRVYECLDLTRLDAWALVDQVDFGTTIAGVEEQQIPVRESEGGWALSWCKDRYWGQLIACVAGSTGVVKVVQFSPSRSPRIVLKLELPNTSTTVTTVSWAPSCGRSYHLVATGSRDGHVRIWKVVGPMVDDGDDDDEEEESDKDPRKKNQWNAQLVADFDDHANIGGDTLVGGVVGKVEWNVTGTILASSGSDGRVRLWKATTTSHGRIWRIAGSVGVEQQDGD